MTSDDLSIREAAVFAYKRHYECLADHLDLSDDEMARIFGRLERRMDSTHEPRHRIEVRVIHGAARE